MSQQSTHVRRLLLIAPDNVALSRAPLGDRAQVEALLKELLPRLTFHPDGVGSFTRGGKELRLRLAGDPVLAIELELPEDGAAFMPPLERVVAKTGWKLLDPDQPDSVLMAAASEPAASGGSGRRMAAFAMVVPVVAGCLWWATMGSRDHLITSDRAAGRKMLGTFDPANPEATSKAAEQFFEQARVVSTIMARERALAPQFKGMRIIHELMMIIEAEIRFQASVGGGNYVDPAMLVFDPSQPGFEGINILPPEFVATKRHGYTFEFIGSGKAKTFFEEFDPAYSSYVYVASPESNAVGPYTFAIVSDTARVHYRTDGRVPDGFDPSVTDAVAADAPPRIKPIPAETDATKQQGWFRRLINRFLNNPILRDAEQTYHEDRAIEDLRVLHAAQQAFMATLGGRGYSTPDALSDPSILGLRFREMPPFVDGYFAQEVREGYRFTFEGSSPFQDDRVTLYEDYQYIAVPVGDGPPSRRSFAIMADGLIRFRTDGAPPQKGDTILGTER